MLHETYEVSTAALEDYVTAYAGSRFGESARFVRNYPTDLALLKSLLPPIETPVKVIAGDHDPMVGHRPPGLKLRDHLSGLAGGPAGAGAMAARDRGALQARR